MKLILYHTDDSPNTINKTLEKIDELEIRFTSEQDLFSPRLLLTRKNEIDYSKINYAKIDKTFYLVSDVSDFHTDFISLSLKEDTLETYKNEILNLDTDISAKSEIDYTSNVPTSKKVQTKIIKSNVVLPDEEHIVVQTSGTTKGDAINV